MVKETGSLLSAKPVLVSYIWLFRLSALANASLTSRMDFDVNL